MAPKQGLLDQNIELTGTNPEIDIKRGDIFYMETASNQTFSIANQVDGRTVIVIVRNTGGTLRTMTFPTSVKSGLFSGEVAGNSETMFTLIFSNGKLYITAIADMT
jgi:hypothetical protein